MLWHEWAKSYVQIKLLKFVKVNNDGYMKKIPRTCFDNLVTDGIFKFGLSLWHSGVLD